MLTNREISRLRTAESSPLDLLFKGIFWKSQIPFLLVLTTGSVMIRIFFPFFQIKLGDPWSYISVLIASLVFIGAFITVYALAKMEVETAILDTVEVKGTTHLSMLKSRPAFRVDLDKLEEDFLPNNQTTPVPAAIRLFQHICKEAKDRKFDSSVNVIQPYREESIQEIWKLQNIQRMALWLGILGTFVGLLLALNRLGGLESINDDERFILLLKQLFEALFIAFGTSVAGLVVAVILGLMLILIRRKQETYFQKMEMVAITMLSLARNAVNKDDFLAEFNQINHTVIQLNERVNNQTLELSKKLTDVESQIKQQTSQIDTGIQELSRAKSQFNDFLKQMRDVQIGFIQVLSDVQSKFIEDVRSVYEVASMQKMSQELKSGILTAGKNISDVLHPSLATISEKLMEFTKSTNTLSIATLQNSQDISKNLKLVENQIISQIGKIQEGIEELSQTKKEFDGFLEKIVYSQEVFLEEVKSVHDAISIKEMGNRLEERISYFGTNISKDLKTSLEDILTRLDGSLSKAALHTPRRQRTNVTDESRKRKLKDFLKIFSLKK